MKSIPFVIVENFFRFVKRQMKTISFGISDSLPAPTLLLESAQ